MNKLPNNTALILIDIQKGFDEVTFWGKRNNHQAEKNMAKLLYKWRETKRPIFHIKHNSRNPKYPLHSSSKGNEIKDLVRPFGNEPIITKNVNSAFIGTNLKEQLDNKKIKTIIIIGLTTDHCVSTTARMAGNYGYNTYVISNATATFDRVGPNGKKYKAQDIHDFALVSLHDEFATVIDTKDLLKIV